LFQLASRAPSATLAAGLEIASKERSVAPPHCAIRRHNMQRLEAAGSPKAQLCTYFSWQRSPSLSPCKATIHQLVKANHDKQRHHENQPARRGMEEAFRQLRFDLGQHTRKGHTTGVGYNRDRHGGDEQDRPHPSPPLEKVTVNERQKRQREQRSDSAARLDH